MYIYIDNVHFTALSFDLQTTCTGDEARCSPFTYDIVIINNGKHCLLHLVQQAKQVVSVKTANVHFIFVKRINAQLHI